MIFSTADYDNIHLLIAPKLSIATLSDVVSQSPSFSQLMPYPVSPNDLSNCKMCYVSFERYEATYQVESLSLTHE